MKVGVYSIRDALTGFTSLTTDLNDASARRNFEHVCMRQDSMYYTHSKDFALLRVAFFDTESGVVDPCVPPEQIYTGLEVTLHDHPF